MDWWPDELRHAGRENLDAAHVARYDGKMDGEAADEARRLGVGPGMKVVDLGAGTGQFARAAATAGASVVAVDVSPVMLARLNEVPGIEVAQAGFLTFETSDADLVYSRFALHHLPDFWKAIALRRVAEMLRPGGVFRLWDVVYGFTPQDAETRVEAWIAANESADVEGGWTRAELAEHVRDEHSTFTWLLEPMIERAGFDIVSAEYDADGMGARYVCRRA